jgi:flagellar biosynthesis protein FlhB
MIQVLIFLSAILFFIIGIFLLKRNPLFLTFMQNDTTEENQQFLRQFGYIFLILALSGLLVGIFDLKLFSLFYIFGLFTVSAIFSFMLAKKIL